MSKLTSAIHVIICIALCQSSAPAQTIEWVRQFGGTRSDDTQSVAVDGLGHVYVTGRMGIPVTDIQTQSDGFLSKYDLTGALIWTRAFGSSLSDTPKGVAADSLGNVFVTGYTIDSLQNGIFDPFVRKYDAAGNLVWSLQDMIPDPIENCCVGTDGLGNAYVAGREGSNLALTKYDATGGIIWEQQFGTTGTDNSDGLAIDGLGNVYISGTTAGNLGGPNAGYWDAFVRKYDASGQHQWTRQIGTADYENTTRVAADALGNVYLSGSTYQSLGGPVSGVEDAYLFKYDSSGNLIWSRQFGTSHQTRGQDIATDKYGNVYITGSTDGVLGTTNFGDFDVYIRKYDTFGTVLWSHQFGSSENDASFAISADGIGNVVVAGFSWGQLGAENFGGSDAYVAKILDLTVPEPTNLVAAAFAVCLFASRRGAVTSIILQFQKLAS